MGKARVPHGDQRARKILFGKAVIENANKNAIDIFRADLRMLQRLSHGCRHQALGSRVV